MSGGGWEIIGCVGRNKDDWALKTCGAVTSAQGVK